MHYEDCVNIQGHDHLREMDLSKGETVLARRSGYHIEVTKLVFLFYSDLI